jgi:PBP1b-binding outer membrane lipoprotein LpoB
MKKIVKTALLIIVFLNSNSIFAQLQEYIENENNRILKAQQTEIEIERFINSNFKNYKLAKEITEELKEHLREEEEFSDEEFEIALINAKRHELRKLFFK